MSPQLTDADIARHDATVGKVLTDADIAARDSNPQGYLSQVGTGLWNTVKGLAQVGVETGGVVFDPLNAVQHLKNLKQMVLDPQVDQAIKAADEWKKGNRSEATGHALAAVLPGVGPAAANIGEKLGNQDYTGAAADATVLGAAMVAPKVAGAIVDAAPVLKGAAKGGYAAATETIPLSRHGVDINVPKPLASGAAAGAAARMVGLPATPAAIIGGAAPIVRGMVRGARRVLNGPVPESFTEAPIQASDILGERTAPAAPAPVVETPGMALARESGQDWAKLSTSDRGMLETVAQARANAAAQPAARPPAPQEPIVTPPPAAAPTAAELEAAATRPADVGRMAPAEARADFEQRRATLEQGQPPTPGQQFAESQGYDWEKLSPDDRQALEQVAKAQANMAAQNLEVPPQPQPPPAPAEPRTLADLMPETEMERQLAESIRKAQAGKPAAAETPPPPAAPPKAENIFAKNARLAKAVRVADAAQEAGLKSGDVFRMSAADFAAKVGEKSISADTMAMVVDKLRKLESQAPPAAPAPAGPKSTPPSPRVRKARAKKATLKDLMQPD